MTVSPETIVLEDPGTTISVGDGVYATHGVNNKGHPTTGQDSSGTFFPTT